MTRKLNKQRFTEIVQWIIDNRTCFDERWNCSEMAAEAAFTLGFPVPNVDFREAFIASHIHNIPPLPLERL